MAAPAGAISALVLRGLPKRQAPIFNFMTPLPLALRCSMCAGMICMCIHATWTWTCSWTCTWSHGHIAGNRQPEPAAKVPQLRRARSPCPIASSARLQAPVPACGERVEVSWRGEGDGKGWLRARIGRRAIGGRSLHTWSGLRTSATRPARLEDQLAKPARRPRRAQGKSREVSGLGWWVAGDV